MILQSVKMAFSAISSNKMRSFLTMLGIIIGVVAVVVLISLVNGATSTVTSEIESLGTNQLAVIVRDDRGHPITLSDLTDIAKNEEFSEIAPVANVNGTAKHGTKKLTIQATGTVNAYERIYGVSLDHGRFIHSADVENSSLVAVIDSDMAEEFFDTGNALGESITINSQSFTVVGVLKANTSMAGSMSSMMTGGANTVYIPYTVASRMAKQPYITTFYVSSSNAEDMQKAETKLNELMLQRFRNDSDAFLIINQSSIMDAMATVTNTMSLLFGGIAAISLLVGGIGIMNIMLVSVTERTREIGIRKAIGAARSSILMQFLVEALMLSLMGCIIGLMLSWFILSIANVVAGDMVTFTMSFDVIALALGFSVLIGVAFGLYPANKAAKLQPIQALRHD
ncbi:MAG TPA: ABC transporter permease [Clostridia bacterium]|nr:ABC transporter permease [Clostridia bacterium]